jgi:hypothetical protein
MEPEPEPEPELQPEPEPEGNEDSGEEYDDGIYEDNGSEDGDDGEGLDEDEASDEDELEQPEFVVNGTPMTKEQQMALRAKSGFVPAAEGLDPSMWKSPHMRLSKFAGRPPTCVFGLGCASSRCTRAFAPACCALCGVVLLATDRIRVAGCAVLQRGRSAANRCHPVPAGAGSRDI